LLDRNDLLLEGLQVLVIQMELELEGPIRDPAALAEEVENLIEHGIEVHEPPSVCPWEVRRP
jgi:hypothetical protein